MLQNHFEPSEITRAKKYQIGRRYANPKDTYERFWDSMRALISECSRMLKPNSRLILVVSKENLMDKRCVELGRKYGLSEERVILKCYRDYKKNYLKYI